MVIIPQMHSSKKCGCGSSVMIPSAELSDKAHKSLAEIKKRKERDINCLIERRKFAIQVIQEKKKNSWWSRLFGYKEQPMPTDEEILNDLKTGTGGDAFSFPETFWIDLQYEKYEDVAYRLLNACNHGEEVYVSTEDLERLL